MAQLTVNGGITATGAATVSGALDVTGNTTLRADVLANSDLGSAMQAFPCRGWCNISGDSSPAATIRASGNISSITDNGTGDYTVTFTNAMPDTSYAFTMCRGRQGAQDGAVIQYSTKSTTQIRCRSWKENFTGIDDSEVCFMVFR